jgi:hypothetical protein
MVSKKAAIVSLLVLISLFLSACGGSPGSSSPGCPTCNNPGKWSECSDDALKSRTNYRCSAVTNYSCEEFSEEKNCLTEIQLEGRKGMQATISPTLDETVKGIIKVEASSVPEGTEMLIVILNPISVQLGPNMAEEDLAKIVRQRDQNSADGWGLFIDTTAVDNSVYNLLIASTYEGAPAENPWLDYTQTQVIVKNP